MRRALLTILLLPLLPLGALGAAPPAAVLAGPVVGVGDGDTVTVLDGGRNPVRVRLLAIDAPERAQPYGKVAKQVLSDRIFGRRVEVLTRSQDRYGRTVGKVMLEGQDLNLELVRQGLAWHYVDFADQQFPGDAERYGEAQRQARQARKGLWSLPDAVPPWRWRREARQDGWGRNR